jgi:hypothetical protein
MCVTPTIIYAAVADGFERREVPCRHCWSCIKTKINDLVGRCLLEAEHAKWVKVLTLTYADDKIEHESQKRSIHKIDFQRFMKRLRYSGIVCRYIAAGEVSDKNTERAHFHVMLFGYSDKMPDVPSYTQKAMLPEWHWGYTYAEDGCTEKSVRYIAKYLQKDRKRRAEKKEKPWDLPSWFTVSKVPAIGAYGFYEMGKRQAEARVMPYTLKYKPPGALQRDFVMSGKCEEIFFDALFLHWPEALNAPCSEWIDNARNRWLKKKHVLRWEALEPKEQEEILLGQVRQAAPKVNPMFDRDPHTGLTWAEVIDLESRRRNEWLEEKAGQRSASKRRSPVG